MGESEISISLGESEYKVNEWDRFNAVLYSAYHDQIDIMISRYEESLKKDSQAVSGMQIASLKVVLNSKQNTVSEKVPFARRFLNTIREYRFGYQETMSNPEMVLYDIKELFETVGRTIIAEACDAYDFSALDIEGRLKIFERQYLEQSYQDDLERGESASFEEYAEENAQIAYESFNEVIYSSPDEFRPFGDLIYPETDRFASDQSHGDDEVIKDAWKEINWRENYLKNPAASSLVLTLKTICQKLIFSVITQTTKTLGGTPCQSWLTWDSYQTCLRGVLSLQNNEAKDRKTTAIESLKNFPIEEFSYKYILNELGDENGDITSLGEYLDINVWHVKNDLMFAYISALPKPDQNDEEVILSQQQGIAQKKTFLGFDSVTTKEEELQKMWEDLDTRLRTVRGALYDTREEAAKVRKDYELLGSQIMKTDFYSYNLLEAEGVQRLKDDFLSLAYESSAFHNDENYVVNELKPVLTYQIQLQTWKKQLQESREPWTTIEDITNGSDVAAVVKDKFKYWNFDGLKKYYPRLLGYERPLLFMKASILGWNQYFVLTNKRGLHITKNNQEDFPIDDGIKFVYNKGFLRIGNDRTPEAVKISLTCSDDEARHLTDILVMIADTLSKREETIFELPENYYPEPGSQVSTGTVFTNQVKGIFKNKVSPFFKGNQNAGKSADTPQSDGNASGVRFCTQCGAKVKVGDRFCAGCGNKLQ